MGAPTPPPTVSWRKGSVAMKTWEWLFDQPLASAWLSSDHIEVARYVELVTGKGEFSMGAGVTKEGLFRTSSSHLAEIRNLSDRLGLSPKAVRALNVTLETEPEAADSADEVAERRAKREAKARAARASAAAESTR